MLELMLPGATSPVQLYAVSDTVHFIGMPEVLAARILAALP